MFHLCYLSITIILFYKALCLRFLLAVGKTDLLPSWQADEAGMI